MDDDKKRLTSLLEKTDCAFKQLLENPESQQLHQLYEQAKSDLDCYLHSFKEDLKSRYGGRD